MDEDYVSYDRFVELLLKSGLLNVGQVSQAKRRAAAKCGECRDEAELLSRLRNHLVLHGLITPWLGEKIATGKHKGFFVDDFVLLDRIQSVSKTTHYLAERQSDGADVIMEVEPSQTAPRGFTYSVTEANDDPLA